MYLDPCSSLHYRPTSWTPQNALLVFGAANKFKKKGTLFLGRKVAEQQTKIEMKDEQKKAAERMAAEKLGNIATGTGQRGATPKSGKLQTSGGPKSTNRQDSRAESRRPTLMAGAIMGTVMNSP